MKEKLYKVGDQVWVVKGRTLKQLILIRCKILSVSDAPKKADPVNGIVTYWLDEPFSLSFSADEFYEDFREATKELRRRARCIREELLDRGVPPPTTYAKLNAWRTHARASIVRGIRQTTPDWKPKWPEGSSPPKTHGVDWFNAGDII